MASRAKGMAREVDSLERSPVEMAADAFFGMQAARRSLSKPAGGDSRVVLGPSPKQTANRHWASSTEIKERYGVGTGQLSKLAKKNPKIRRSATIADRERLKNPKLLYMYDKRLIYEMIEGAFGAE